MKGMVRGGRKKQTNGAVDCVGGVNGLMGVGWVWLRVVGCWILVIGLV